MLSACLGEGGGGRNRFRRPQGLLYRGWSWRLGGETHEDVEFYSLVDKPGMGQATRFKDLDGFTDATAFTLDYARPVRSTDVFQDFVKHRVDRAFTAWFTQTLGGHAP